jgi:AsmA protein
MRKALKIVLILLVVLVAAVVALPFLISANQFRPMVEANLTKALGRQVTVGDLKLSILSGGVSADNLAIAEDPKFGSNPFVKAKSLKLGVELKPLIFSRKLNVTGLTIDQPEVSLIQTPEGQWNFSSLGASSPKQEPAPAASGSSSGNLDMSVSLVELKNGRFSLATAGRAGKPFKLEDVNLQVRDFLPNSQFPFSLSAKVAGGGDIKLEGKAGPINSKATELTPLSASLDVSKLDLVGSGIGAFSPGLAGILNFKGSGRSRNGEVALTARLTTEGLKIAPNGTPARKPVQLDIAMSHNLTTHTGILRRGDIKVGAATASLTGRYAQRAGQTVLNMKLAGSNMPIPELAELLPPLGIALPAGSSLKGGVASADLTMEGPTEALISKGSIALNKTQLANFDLGSKVATVASMVGIKTGPNTNIETFSANLTNSRQGLAADNVRFLAPDIGELTGAGTMSPANALDFKMRVQLHTSGRAAVLGQMAVPFLVTGSATDPIFRPDSKALASEASKQVKEVAKEKATKAATGLLERWLGGKKQPTQ